MRITLNGIEVTDDPICSERVEIPTEVWQEIAGSPEAGSLDFGGEKWEWVA